MAEEKEPQTLKEGEIGVKKEDWDRIEAKAKDMDKYKAETKTLKGDLDDLQEKIEKLEKAQAKAKPKEGEPDTKAAVELAVGEARRELEKAHGKALEKQEQQLKVSFAAQLALTEGGAKSLYLGSIDLSDVTDPETARERVEAFIKDNPEIVAKEKEPEPKGPPAVTGPTTGPPAPGAKAEEGPKTPGEREAVLREHMKSKDVAIVRGSGTLRTPG